MISQSLLKYKKLVACVLSLAWVYGCQSVKEEAGESVPAPTMQGGKMDGWSTSNHPARFQWNFKTDFYALPLAGKTSKVPWSDDYWAFNKGGIAYRWQTKETPFHYGTGPALDVLKNMAQADIEKLSPAEKYDIFVGRYDYPTVAELKRITSPSAASWEGFCDGWSNAAIHYLEPKAVTLTGANDIVIRFASSDIKALLTFFQSRKAKLNRIKLGEICAQDLHYHPEFGDLPECKDTNPGTFHIAMANMIALEDRAFVGDITRDVQIWNQPFHAYSSTIEKVTEPSLDADPETVKELEISTRLVYTVEVYPHLNPTHADRTANYHYRLELNANNEIVGGSWISYDRPDVLWYNPPTGFYGYFTDLEKIYRAATEGR